MDLRKYLFENRISQTSFAKKIGYNKNSLALIYHGKRKPGKGMALAIKYATNGLVDYPDILKNFSLNCVALNENQE